MQGYTQANDQDKAELTRLLIGASLRLFVKQLVLGNLGPY